MVFELYLYLYICIFVFVSDGKRVVFVHQQDDEDWLWEDEEMCEEDYEFQVTLC